MTFDYEAEREANIKKNQEILAGLGLDVEGDAFLGSAAPPAQAASKSKNKRGADDMEEDYNPEAVEEESKGYVGGGDTDEEMIKEAKRSHKKKRPNPPRPSAGTRRSSRHEGRAPIDYSADGFEKPDAKPKLISKAAKKKAVADGEEDEEEGLYEDGEERDRPRHKIGERTQDPKQFGNIPGIPVGKTWELRMHCSTDAVHAPTVAGIAGNRNLGAWSIALSGGYEDDIDLGYAFTFTGAGGRDLKGTKQNPKNLRTAPQSKDQSWDENPLNAALKKSSETKKPVRVIRGYKLHSKFAPVEGYRYDGLYTVEKAWMEKGLNKGGFLVCKYALKRVPGQPPLPERDLDAEAEARKGQKQASKKDVESEDDASEYPETEDMEPEEEDATTTPPEVAHSQMETEADEKKAEVAA
ncbi:hypothetical protein FRC04_001061 [Tulasnella sp. 424]|nr:hypothetical protein FRC04_001061 [Tulasnella sp. 424]KAG8969843.1 hypothetical protein FRC05_000820 [Tulasnella sp. 425]